MADLFQQDNTTISSHNSVVAKFATTAADGKTYQVDYVGFMNLFNENYSRRTSRKVKSIRKSLAEQGKFLGTYGYLKNPENKHQLIPDPETVSIARRIFHVRCMGNSFRSIAATLNQEGIPSPRTLYYQRKGDTSKKIRAVMRAKGNSGEPLCTNPPYGYKKRWIVDEEATEVVNRIFVLCVDGKGSMQIAKLLTADKVLTVKDHCAKQSGKALPDKPYQWSAKSVAGILERPEYNGCTVNFKNLALHTGRNAKAVCTASDIRCNGDVHIQRRRFPQGGTKAAFRGNGKKQ